MSSVPWGMDFNGHQTSSDAAKWNEFRQTGLTSHQNIGDQLLILVLVSKIIFTRWRFRVISWFITFYNPIWIEEYIYIRIIHYKYKYNTLLYIYSYVQLSKRTGAPIRDSPHPWLVAAAVRRPKLVSCGPAPSFSQLGADFCLAHFQYRDGSKPMNYWGKDQFGSWKSIWLMGEKL